MLRFDRQIFSNQFTQKFGAPSSSVQSGLNALLNQIEPDDTNWANIYCIAYGLATFKWETANTFHPVTEQGPVSYFAKYDAGTSNRRPVGEHASGGRTQVPGKRLRSNHRPR
jgi:putative chitinase